LKLDITTENGLPLIRVNKETKGTLRLNTGEDLVSTYVINPLVNWILSGELDKAITQTGPGSI